MPACLPAVRFARITDPTRRLGRRGHVHARPRAARFMATDRPPLTPP
ncbi:hypothetical protein OH738_40960 (plasmid) [Streptomyces hirsutus]|nr:hypothetical protein OH738_40960 [Streptomyces hirsutus]